MLSPSSFFPSFLPSLFLVASLTDPLLLKGQDQRDSHQQMEEILAAIRDSSSLNNPFFGTGKIRQLEFNLRKIDRSQLPQAYIDTGYALGLALLNHGQIQEGIDQFADIRTYLAEKPGNDALKGLIAYHLGMAHLRLGETENCCALNTPESCILPLQEQAIHTDRTGSEQAIRFLEEAMELRGDDPDFQLRSQWFLNLAHMTLGTFPLGVPSKLRFPPEQFQRSDNFPNFANVSRKWGIENDNLAGGVVVDDFDGDDDLDIITSSFELSEPLRFLENIGPGRFVEREAGLSGMLGGLNLVHADYDNDGDLDLYVLRGAWWARLGQHPNSLLQNDGTGTFRDVTLSCGMGEAHYPSQTAAWADYDLDGDLDLYVGNESTPNLRSPGQLFQNQGNGQFREVATQAGVLNNRMAKGVVWGDIDGDRWPDLIISNLKQKNRLYRNLGNGKFADITKKAGIESPISSFPLWTWDFNNDGHLDLYISSFSGSVEDATRTALGEKTEAELSAVYQGNGTTKFRNVTSKTGPSVPILGMGANFGDLDNDGFLDFYVGTGEPNLTVILPNLLYHNRSGKRFADVTMASGLGHLQKGHAVSFADLDGDGDQDVFEQLGGAYPVDAYRDAVFENPGSQNHWVEVQLVGKTSNRSAIGSRLHARITEDQKKRSIYRFVNTGGSFGGNPLRQHLGIGKAQQIDVLEVFWPTTGVTQKFHNVKAGMRIEITEDVEEFRILQPRGSSL
ncbi:MAG: CRTAC1 family protein [Verrucomicrobiota bacterium]